MGNWSGNPAVNEYHWTQDEADAVLSRHEGQWFLSRSMSMDDEWKHDYLGDVSTDEAFKAADKILWQEFADYHEDREQKPKLTIVDRVRDAIQDRNEDGMIRFAWSRNEKGPYVVQISDKDGVKYLSRAGMEDLGPDFDTIAKAAIFPVKRDAQHLAKIAQGIHETGQISVVTQTEAYEVAATQELRQEAQVAYDAWQNDLQNAELENDYFEKLTKLDQVLADRGLERGETIDEEMPMRSFEPLSWASDRLQNWSQDRGRGR
jgi:hypothetical protein